MIACRTEYDVLERVMMCPPQYMRIQEVINETQEKFAADDIDSDVALSQYHNLVDVLRQKGVEVLELPPSPQYPEQVFTRDIGFVIGPQLFVSNMDRQIRQGEIDVLKKWLGQRSLSAEHIRVGNIEGGDVLVDGDTVWVGQSSRTDHNATEALQQRLPGLQVVEIPFDDYYLHLDCVFNILSPEEAIIFPPAFSDDTMHMLSGRYDLIPLSEAEQFTLGTNVLSIGHKEVVALPVNPVINRELINRGYDIIEVDINEIIKSGGSFRCITLPLLRKEYEEI